MARFVEDFQYKTISTSFIQYLKHYLVNILLSADVLLVIRIIIFLQKHLIVSFSHQILIIFFLIMLLGVKIVQCHKMHQIFNHHFGRFFIISILLWALYIWCTYFQSQVASYFKHHNIKSFRACISYKYCCIFVFQATKNLKYYHNLLCFNKRIFCMY